jgi:hypothetical protein
MAMSANIDTVAVAGIGIAPTTKPRFSYKTKKCQSHWIEKY